MVLAVSGEVITIIIVIISADSAGHVIARGQSQREQPTNQISLCRLGRERQREQANENPTDSIKKKQAKKVRGVQGDRGDCG